VAYKTTQSFIPGAEWTERHVGLPIAGTMARISGVEGGLRWALQPKRDVQDQSSSGSMRISDIESGYSDAVPGPHRRSSELSSAEPLPVYNPGDRSPPYSEHQIALQGRDRQPPPGWRQQLVISTSGLGIAMNDQSLRSLRYCLRWLKWANGRLDEAIAKLKSLLETWDRSADSQGPYGSSRDSRQAALLARIGELKTDVLQTLKQVVAVVSNYAGGALPDNARNLVHRHLVSLPQRFSIASAMTNDADGTSDEAAGSAKRVMVLAQEGLEMMGQVSRVVNDTLVSAESWCEKLGRRTDQEGEHEQTTQTRDYSEDTNARSVTFGSDGNNDVKMEM